MRILIVHNHYQQPGGERVAVEAQIVLLRARGHSVVLYTKDNAVINQYGWAQRVAFFPRTVFSWATYREIRTLVRCEHPDVAHVHNVYPLVSPSVYQALKDSGVPIVQTVHNFRFLCPNGLLYTHGRICERCKYGNALHAVRWRCYRRSCILSALYALTIGLHRRWGTFQMINHFIALTEFTARKLVESGLTTREKIAILGNFLPDPLPQPGSFEQREPYVVYLGRLSPEKGLDVLIEAMATLPHLGLKVLGSGPLAESLQAMAREKELRSAEFLGYVDGEEKCKLLQRALGAVVPSVWYENFPFTVLESLAAGVPVVASNLGSLPHIVEDGRSGLLFRPGDSQDLRQKLVWLAAYPKQSLAMGRYGRMTAETRYSAEAHYGRLMTIYAEVGS